MVIVPTASGSHQLLGRVTHQRIWEGNEYYLVDVLYEVRPCEGRLYHGVIMNPRGKNDYGMGVMRLESEAQAEYLNYVVEPSAAVITNRGTLFKRIVDVIRGKNC